MTLEETVNTQVKVIVGEGWEVIAYGCLLSLASSIGTALPFTIGESAVMFNKEETRESLGKAVWEDIGIFLIQIITAPIGDGIGEYSSEQARWATIGSAIGASVVKKFVKGEPNIKYYKT